MHSHTIDDLPPARRRKVIHLYLEAFVRNETPCVPCGGKCCSMCSSYNGYLGEDKAKAAKKKYGFDRKLGFNTPTGCRLPRNERSDTCIGFYCEKFDKTNKPQLEAISALRREIWNIPQPRSNLT